MSDEAPPVSFGSSPRHRHRIVVLGLAIAVVVLLAGATAYALTLGTNGTTNDGATSRTASTTATTGPKLTMAQIEATVDPALVDITSQIGNSATAAGTGMIIDNEFVLTNNHVISGGTSISVHMHATNVNLPATVAGFDATQDVAVLHVAGLSGVSTIAPEATAVAVGAPIVVIGNALGKGGTPATPGSVTALDTTITASDETGEDTETLQNVIQLSANVEPGDSGGAVADAHGRVIGMTTAATTSSVKPVFATSPTTATPTTTTGYAIPISRALSLAGDITAGRASSTVHIGDHGILGVDIVPFAGGRVVIVGIEAGSSAASAGLDIDDTITSVNGVATPSLNALDDAMEQTHVGDTVAIGFVDPLGGTHQVAVKLTTGAG